MESSARPVETQSVTTPKFSFALPVLNGGQFLDQALSSLTEQSERDIEVIVFDNASTDDSSQIALKHARLDPRIRVLSGQRVSASDNFSRALAQTSSNFVAWAAHDDVWDANFVTTCLANFDDNVDYLSPNWWVGDTRTGKGASRGTHLLAPLSSLAADQRLLYFLNLHHQSHKCNLVYGAYRREFLFEMLAKQDLSDDGAFTAAVAYFGRGKFLDDVLFQKHHGENPWRKGLIRGIARISHQRLPRNAQVCFRSAKLESLSRIKKLFPSQRSNAEAIYDRYALMADEDFIVPEKEFRALLDASLPPDS